MTRCRSCPATVRWVLTAATGARMPLDPDPVEDGNVVLDWVNGSVVARVLRKGETHDGPRYVSHFATCPARK